MTTMFLILTKQLKNICNHNHRLSTYPKVSALYLLFYSKYSAIRYSIIFLVRPVLLGNLCCEPKTCLEP